MPVISMFYGMIIRMFYFDNQEHKLPHIHVEYGGENAVLSIPDGNILSGHIPANKVKLIQAWIEIHKEDLMANWSLAVKGTPTFKIAPLQ